jgi:hypothetical protein
VKSRDQGGRWARFVTTVTDASGFLSGLEDGTHSVDDKEGQVKNGEADDDHVHEVKNLDAQPQRPAGTNGSTNGSPSRTNSPQSVNANHRRF